MAEGSETPGEASPRPSERDLLAERRARRAVDLDPLNPASNQPTDALTRRAEAAEATVQTLETHLANLRQQVREATEERATLAERLAAEQAVVAESEHELRRVKQREYAEQQLRVESEDRRAHAERDSRAEIDRLSRRLGASEHHARELAERLESVQRELDEAEQATAAELADLRSVAIRQGERELQLRLTELERRALEARGEIDAERRLRERAEGQLAEMRAGYRRVELLVVELKGFMAQLRAAVAREPQHESVPGVPGDRSEVGQREELADALAAAVERLRARADASALESEDPAETTVSRRPSEPERLAAAHGEGRTPHKHSMSLLTRIKRRRKQRRERRSAAAEPPNIQPQ